MKQLILTLLFSTLLTTVYASEGMTLHCTSQENKATGDTYTRSSFVQIEENEIIWGRKAGQGSVFAIQSQSGSWNQETHIGSLVYTVTTDQGNGTITIDGNGATATIIIELDINEDKLHIALQVDEVTYESTL